MAKHRCPPGNSWNIVDKACQELPIYLERALERANALSEKAYAASKKLSHKQARNAHEKAMEAFDDASRWAVDYGFYDLDSVIVEKMNRHKDKAIYHDVIVSGMGPLPRRRNF